jgi:hypothetical protein
MDVKLICQTVGVALIITMLDNVGKLHRTIKKGVFLYGTKSSKLWTYIIPQNGNTILLTLGWFMVWPGTKAFLF